VKDVTAFILAGGKSSRMGSDKAFVELNGRLLIDHAMRRFKAFQCDIFIVGPKSKFNAFGRVIEDRYPDTGPLAGIHAGLERSDTELCLVTAVDVPLVPASLLERLVEAARKERVEVVLPKTGNGFQPLCALYSKSFAPAAEAALKTGERKIDKVIFSRPHLVFDVDAEGFSSEMFLNINSPEDLAEAEREMSEQQARAAKP
jgi:molybdopterin-guanine dinucleotide biosynthesis protein A